MGATATKRPSYQGPQCEVLRTTSTADIKARYDRTFECPNGDTVTISYENIPTCPPSSRPGTFTYSINGGQEFNISPRFIFEFLTKDKGIAESDVEFYKELILETTRVEE